MATKTRKRLTDEEREERRTHEREIAKQAVEELRSSEGWQRWLASRSRFHRYSLHNQLLIAVQGHEMLERGWVDAAPRRVAGFHDWIKNGYVVRKRPEHVPEGGWAIKIWAPMKPSKKAVDAWEDTRRKASAEAGVELDGQRPRTLFRLVNVFGDCQVDPLPPPAEPIPLEPPIREAEGDDLASAWAPLVALVKSAGGDVALEDTQPAGGYLRPADLHVGINEHASINQRVRTLVHETAHLLVRTDRQDGDPELDYASEELVVESVAMSVTGVLGLDTSEYSVPYLASWSEKADLEVVERHARFVNRLCNRLEDALEAVLA